MMFTLSIRYVNDVKIEVRSSFSSLFYCKKFNNSFQTSRRIRDTSFKAISKFAVGTPKYKSISQSHINDLPCFTSFFLSHSTQIGLSNKSQSHRNPNAILSHTTLSILLRNSPHNRAVFECTESAYWLVVVCLL